MNIQPITMDKKIAQEHFERYRALVRQRSDKEDVALMRGFKALSAGKQIIDAVEVMRSAGVDHLFRPKLAIIRADATECFFRNDANGAGVFRMAQSDWRYATRRFINFPEKTFPAVLDSKLRWETWKSAVPSIPAQFRPRDAISNYHILWEPEWEAEPPRDPLLLKRIAKFTFVVLAHWDLTPLERSVLRGV